MATKAVSVPALRMTTVFGMSLEITLFGLAMAFLPGDAETAEYRRG